MATRHCHQCGGAVAIDDPIPRDAECESCGADIRACMNCRHHDPAYNNQCRETEAEPVPDKERRNFCEYFSYSTAPYDAPSRQSRSADEARRKLEGLFQSGKPAAGGVGGRPAGSTGPKDRAQEAREKLDALFRKKKDDQIGRR